MSSVLLLLLFPLIPLFPLFPLSLDLERDLPGWYLCDIVSNDKMNEVQKNDNCVNAIYGAAACASVVLRSLFLFEISKLS